MSETTSPKPCARSSATSPGVWTLAWRTSIACRIGRTGSSGRAAAPFHAREIAATRQRQRRTGVAWQQRQERRHALGIGRHRWWQLPAQRTEAVIEREHARREEVDERFVEALQSLHAGDEARSVDREHEAIRHRVAPCTPGRVPLAANRTSRRFRSTGTGLLHTRVRCVGAVLGDSTCRARARSARPECRF